MNIDKMSYQHHMKFLDRTKNSYDILDSATQHTPIRIYARKSLHISRKRCTAYLRANYFTVMTIIYHYWSTASIRTNKQGDSV